MEEENMNIMHDISPERISPADFIATIEITKGSKKKYELTERNRIIDFRQSFVFFSSLSG